ncbi:Crp/Fnr family transcriptional regulator [Actinomadura sp. 7K507]|uniref:Crp/Fnr family transcriptional regulator n=1 Tax=Actinomadura sp. 7K507 TaxID=2530365 RepID=UPI00104EC99D|nr:Crp/Fnr family transcriptional regulator [Actinomadura sp. 7K507]TDC90230.1 Crp/Fnr family transcriptional regulator [Actinomadura sp. 7K507]
MDGFGAIIGPPAWRELTALGRPGTYEPGEILMRQGDIADQVLLLVAGRVKVSLVDAEGHSMLLAVRGPGQVLGDITVIDGARRSATVSAIDECEVSAVSRDSFLRALQAMGLHNELVRFAMRLFRESEELRLELATLKAGPRVVRGLLRLAVSTSREVKSIDIGLSQAEFGEAIGLSRASVADKLAELRSAGLVNTKRERIIITDLPGLRDRASR